MAYERIDWENEPSVDTPLNEDNLNHMEDGIVANEEAIGDLSTEVEGKQDALTFDNTPTTNSSNPVTSDGIKTALDAKVNNINPTSTGTLTHGTNSDAEGHYGSESVAIGKDAKALDINAFAVGNGAKTSNAEQVVIGNYNEVKSTPEVIIGVGSADNNRKNAAEFYSNGDTIFGGEVTDGSGNVLADKIDTDDVLAMLPADSASGNPAVITDAFGGACKSLKLTLEPIQSGSGTPSPQNARPISGLTEANVVRTGKNLLPQLCDAGTKASVTLTKNSDGSYTMSGSPSANNQFASVAKLKLLPGTYIWRASADGTSDIGSDANGYAYLMGVNGSGEWIRSYGVSTLTVTVESEVALGFAWYNATSLNITFYPMIRPSSIADATFEAYNGEIYTVDLDGTRYGAVLDVETGVLIVTDVLKVFDGSDDENITLGWEYNGSTLMSNIFIFPIFDMKISTPQDISDLKTNWIEPRFKADDLYLDEWTCRRRNNLAQILVYTPSSATNTITLASLKSILAQTPLQIAYKLATPITVQLTPEEVTLLHGDNVLTTDADSVEASYSADIALYITKKIAEGISQGNRSLSKGGSSESTEEVKKEETPKESEETEEIKEETKEEVKEEK